MVCKCLKNSLFFQRAFAIIGLIILVSGVGRLIFGTVSSSDYGFGMVVSILVGSILIFVGYTIWDSGMIVSHQICESLALDEKKQDSKIN